MVSILYQGVLHVHQRPAGELVVFAEATSSVTFQANGNVSFVLGSAVKHPHQLVLGNYSVHTHADALAAGEANIRRIAAELRRKELSEARARPSTMTTNLSATLLTPETSLLLILDYQSHVLKDIGSTDHRLIELNGRALARASKVFQVPVILSTIGVKLRGDPPTLPSIRAELADHPEYDRNTMNAWEDKEFRAAVEKTGRRRLIFVGLWTEVCLLYPVLHAERDGFETYFVADAVGGSTRLAHDTAVQRMVQAGSQPLTVGSLLTEWIRDWGTTPYTKEFLAHQKWYAPEIEHVRKRLRGEPFQADVA